MYIFTSKTFLKELKGGKNVKLTLNFWVEVTKCIRVIPSGLEGFYIMISLMENKAMKESAP